jgi:hypothetical protein
MLGEEEITDVIAEADMQLIPAPYNLRAVRYRIGVLFLQHFASILSRATPGSE